MAVPTEALEHLVENDWGCIIVEHDCAIQAHKCLNSGALLRLYELRQELATRSCGSLLDRVTLSQNEGSQDSTGFQVHRACQHFQRINCTRGEFGESFPLPVPTTTNSGTFLRRLLWFGHGCSGQRMHLQHDLL